MKTRTKIIILGTFLLLALLFFGMYWIFYLDTAHSTFNNYYNFRGCIELVNRTDDYGYCKLHSGEIIKIVKYKDKWYLDGDLPVSCGLINCP